MSTGSSRRVLVIGGGAREHTLCWSLSRGSRRPQLYCAPGNAGTSAIATNLPIAAEAMLEQSGVGAAGQKVLLQEYVEGVELSLMAFVDGGSVAVMPPARDYKRVGDGDCGPNTGGMGAYCPPGFAPPKLLAEIQSTILE